MARHSQDSETVLLVTISDHDLDELEAAHDGEVWRAHTFADHRGGIWLPSTAALLTCPNVDDGVLEGIAAVHNAFPDLIAEIRRLRKIESAAKELDDNPLWIDQFQNEEPTVTFKQHRVNALSAALTEEGE